MPSVVDGSSPDVVFYYSLLLPSSVINQTVNGTDEIQTSNGVLFADPNFTIPIGNFAFNVTIYNINKSLPNNLYEGTGTNVYFLPEGTISNSIDIQFTKDEKGEFVVPSKKINVYQILSGSGDFLNSRGILVQTSDTNLGRRIQVYFENK